MNEWTKRFTGVGVDYSYFCECGRQMDDEIEYNADTGTYTCIVCDVESPDLDNI